MDKRATARAHDIAVVISDIAGGGAQRVLTNLIGVWLEQGFRICLLTLAGNSSDMYALPGNITRLTLRPTTIPGTKRDHHSTPQEENPRPIARYIPWISAVGRALDGIREIRNLRRALSTADAPVVLAFMTSSNIKTIIAAMGLDVRVVVSERIDPERQPRIWPWHVLRRWSYRYADAVTANTHGALKSMESYVPRSKLSFVPNPISFPAVSSAGSRRGKIILNVGRLTRQKAQDVLLDAYARVSAEAPEWRLVIVGHGPWKDDLHAQSSALGLSERVTWIDWTTEIEKHYAEAAIFVLPSRFEGTPNALLEAMSFGLPSIVSNGSPGPLEHVADGESGLIVPVDDEIRLAEAILRLATNREFRDRLGASARKAIEEMNNDDIQEAWSVALGLPNTEHVRRTVSSGDGPRIVQP